MILLGDLLIPCEETFMIYHKDQIAESKANSTIIFNFNKEVMSYAFENDVSYGIIVSNIKEAIYANALNASYIICQPKLAANIQKVADNYMFDAKVLAIIESEDEIENIANDEIDGAIYRDLVT